MGFIKCVVFFEGGKNVLIKWGFFVDMARESRAYKIVYSMMGV